MKEYDSLMVSVEKLFEEEDKLEHAFTFQLSKSHRKILQSILRQMFEHPNVKYSSKLKRVDQE